MKKIVMVRLNEEEEYQSLIPLLPDDIALDCLARIPFGSFSKIRPVCKKWHDLLASPSFSRRRRRLSADEDLVLLTQAADASADLSLKLPSPPPCQLTLYNATRSSWHRVPTPDDEPLPIFSQVAALGRELFVLGGWDPITLLPVADVRILHLDAMTWRRGRSMTSARSFFACAAVGGKVYVAGGHDGEKNALRTAEAYDVAADEWVSLPPMTRERDESQGLILGGKFWAVSGYRTEEQGRFARSAEWYDVDRREWITVEDVLEDAKCAASCCGFGSKMWGLDPTEKKVREFEFEVGPASEEGTCAAGAVMGNGERVWVGVGEGKGGWVVDLGSGKWVRIEAPDGFLGPVYSAAAFRV